MVRKINRRTLRDTGFYILLIIVVIGVVANFIRDHRPPTDRAIRQLSSVAQKDITTHFKPLEVLQFQPLVTTYVDKCYAGQNNYKVHEGYRRQCAVRVNQFYGFNTDFKNTLTTFEGALQQTGWTPRNSSNTINDTLTQYYDKYSGNRDPRVSINFGGDYLVSDLPLDASKYLKGSSGSTEVDEKDYDNLTLHISCAEQKTKGFSLRMMDLDQAPWGGTGSGFEYKSDHSVHTATIQSQNTALGNQYFCMVSIEKVYFST